MSKTVICGVYEYDCLFWERSQSEIDNVMMFSMSMDPVIVGNTLRDSQCLSS